MRWVVCLSLIALCSGCGTTYTHLFDISNQAYPGVRMDCKLVADKQPGFIIDLPFSAVADTFFLPFDAWPPTPDPVQGWQFKQLPEFQFPHSAHNTNHLDKAIVDDYQAFITKKKLYVISGVTRFFEDGKGHRAVKFDGYLDNVTWTYVLIYDDQNKRIKVVQFNRRVSMC